MYISLIHAYSHLAVHFFVIYFKFTRIWIHEWIYTDPHTSCPVFSDTLAPDNSSSATPKWLMTWGPKPPVTTASLSVRADVECDRRCSVTPIQRWRVPACTSDVMSDDVMPAIYQRRAVDGRATLIIAQIKPLHSIYFKQLSHQHVWLFYTLIDAFDVNKPMIMAENNKCKLLASK